MSTYALPILQNARKNIEKPEYWGQGMASKRPNKGQMCLGEAIWAASGLSLEPLGGDNIGYDDPRRKAYADASFELCSEGAPSVISFNDHKDTTHDKVLALLDRTISRLESEFVSVASR